MQYFFELGNHPEISLMELNAVFPKARIDLLSYKIAILEIQDLDAEQTVKRMGGIIKIGQAIGSLKKFDTEKIINLTLQNLQTPQADKKIFFGISFYGRQNHNLKLLGMQLKRTLEENGKSTRWVTGKDKVLSSVIVTQNKLLEKGFELVLSENDADKSISVGLTQAVQPFKNISFRDYNRPARDDLSGMLPPKLAQIMINLASQNIDGFLLDPFCGSGTILMEALIAGYKNIIANDLSAKAIEDSKKNLAWLNQVSEIQYPIYNIQYHNISSEFLSREIMLNFVDCIATEPYLGPQRGKIETKKVIAELESLYSKSLQEFHRILKNHGRIAMVWPMIYDGRYHRQLNPNFKGFKLVNSLNKKLLTDTRLHFTSRQTAIYKREGQKVWREIMVLEKN